jgi:colanic acid/amylovoran biosynthesis glycosyltransferase
LRPGRLRALVRAARASWPPDPVRPSWTTSVGLLRRYARLAAQRPDIVHLEWETVAGHYLPLMGVWDCPVVLSCRGRALEVYPHAPGSESWIARLPSAFARAAAVHCVSEVTRDYATAFGLDAGKACVIRPAVDTDFFQPPPTRAPAPCLRVLSVGDLIWVKGQEYGIAATGEVVRRGVPLRLAIAGDGPDRDRIVATVTDLGLEGHVELLGRLDPRSIRTRLHQTDVLLHASLAEGIPNVVLEAMACGVPPVVTDVGGTREAVRNGREGFLLAPRDTLGMADSLQALWTDAALRERMGRASRARVEEGFALAHQIPQILALYERVLSSR